ncbi:multidrug effflux MFS transporter [Magnetospirillum sulfuroxidans]|uniref:Bcr/CflA family efflux transporter n=1 Tax=Magnetospirillum sulfuroxidans TaxID=611300 RepID=A0ABS5ICB4_9PROT|nr:multidrug effflux MFS transporter [Magnetospirillum sulfuroxidans]MBR9972069.1 multidrug effflux MFS transporter [Magnetospirillum sulfuroxidans]
MSAPSRFIVLILGTLTALAPLAIDMYLPALPQMQTDFAASTAQVQITLAAFLAGFALGPALYGPVSDGWGRKLPLYAGLGLFTLTSLACLFAPTVEWFTIARFFQAIGACAGGVIGRAMVRDLYPPQETQRVYASLMLVMGAAPIVAPMAGSLLINQFGWRSIFATQALLGAACLILLHRWLVESHPPHLRHRAGFLGALRAYARLLADRSFMAYALAGSAGMAGLFTYISGSPFVLIQYHGVALDHFGWIFGANAFGFILAGQINGRVLHKLDRHKVLAVAQWVQLVLATGLVLIAATDFGGVVGLSAGLFVTIACIGFIAPNSAVLVMAPRGGAIAGTASALLGMLQFAIGACASALVGLVHAHSAVPMAAVILGFALMGPLSLRLLKKT